MSKFHLFKHNISEIELPKEFTFPYNYTPHPLAEIAVKQLQEYLKNQTDFEHNFGINNPTNKNALGKMLGVLVVKNTQNELGFLAAFSGKLADSTQHNNFVPPVFDVLDEKGFYRITENKINSINHEIETLENNSSFLSLKEKFSSTENEYLQLLQVEKDKIKHRQQLRKKEYKTRLNSEKNQQNIKVLQEKNNQLKINESFYLREYEIYLDEKLHPLKVQLDFYQSKIDTLKKERAQKSAWVQQEIFKHYNFLNSKREAKNLLDIFKNTKQNIPAGAGDCCAPKLLQYAFLHNFTPICMAEFWWGKPLQTSVRKHGFYYGACVGKCKPILTHMLQGMSVEENPLYKELSTPKTIEVIYEDEELAVINKPYDLLTVSGTEIKDSVETRVKKLWPQATGPMIVHRLDMSTSGVLLIAKTKESHKHLQEQFKNKTIKKQYIAILDGVINQNSGSINLPLKVDFHHRPKQMVCFINGKKALTKWNVIEVKNNQTKINFYPITGRTHQLRMHAAHHLGLNTSILGDDLYGKKLDRLYLHAEKIQFLHPRTKLELEFTIPTPF
ncbi:pseudouridine synthase [Tenacibaculum holothuriorum]|uniref:Pseudouridine synthase n=1 Tax=Tenacibaculum holothuriorum TaxID=1635173 RepID=A0A1Y2PI86_9FLAO|nr:RluA family pseudouridine synthase [Tenacibaculum holothuriorum]OSY89507.1 pseudouridine synthase [Tenacibaculum holothuriorum]